MNTQDLIDMLEKLPDEILDKISAFVDSLAYPEAQPLHNQNSRKEM